MSETKAEHFRSWLEKQGVWPTLPHEFADLQHAVLWHQSAETLAGLRFHLGPSWPEPAGALEVRNARNEVVSWVWNGVAGSRILRKDGQEQASEVDAGYLAKVVVALLNESLAGFTGIPYQPEDPCEKDGYRQLLLYRATEKGDIPETLRLLGHVPPEAVEGAVHTAAERGHRDLLEALAKCLPQSILDSALWLSVVFEKNLTKARLLLECGANAESLGAYERQHLRGVHLTGSTITAQMT